MTNERGIRYQLDLLNVKIDGWIRTVMPLFVDFLFVYFFLLFFFKFH